MQPGEREREGGREKEREKKETKRDTYGWRSRERKTNVSNR